MSHIVRGAKKKKKKIHSRLFFFPAPPDCSLFSVKNYLKINLSNSLQKLENQGCYLWDKTWSRSTHKENRETDREFVWILTSNLQLYFFFFFFCRDNSRGAGCVCFLAKWQRLLPLSPHKRPFIRRRLSSKPSCFVLKIDYSGRIHTAHTRSMSDLFCF